MKELSLISHHLCPYVQRAAMVLLEKQVPHRRTYIDLSNKPDWFAAVSPLGRVPVLLVGQEPLFESQVIAEFLDEATAGSLHPADPLEKAQHRSWIEYGSETLKNIAAFYSAPDARSFEEKRHALSMRFARIERELQGPYFAGPQFHMIDGVWGTVFRYLDVFDEIGPFALLDAAPKVRDWRRTIAGRAAVKSAAPADYGDRLLAFLQRRDSHLATLLSSAP